MEEFFIKLFLGLLYTAICIGLSYLIYYCFGWEYDTASAAGCLSVCAILLHFLDKD